MRSFVDIADRFQSIPIDVAMALAGIERSRGREDLFQAQAPHVLERLAARARFDSITASCAIESVVLEDERARRIIRSTVAGPFGDRAEQEVAGCRDAVDLVTPKPPAPLTVPLLLGAHRVLMSHTGDPEAGRLKAADNFVGSENPDGSWSVIFETIPAGAPTESALSELVGRYEEALADGTVPRLLLVAALVLDLLAIHPFDDGNGRIARLVTTRELLRHGYGVARYVALEQRVLESRNSYYVALRQSQRGWHEDAHDPLPWTRYLLRVIEDGYADLERSVAAEAAHSGASKRDQVRGYILDQAPRRFRFAQIADALPDISRATIRAELADLRREGRLTVGRGRSAVWERVS